MTYHIVCRGRYFGGFGPMPTWVGKGSARKYAYAEAVNICYILGTKYGTATHIVDA